MTSPRATYVDGRALVGGVHSAALSTALDPDFAEAARSMAAGVRSSEETAEQRAFAEEHARHFDVCRGCGACGDCGMRCQCADVEDADPRYRSEDDAYDRSRVDDQGDADT